MNVAEFYLETLSNFLLKLRMVRKHFLRRALFGLYIQFVIWQLIFRGFFTISNTIRLFVMGSCRSRNGHDHFRFFQNFKFLPAGYDKGSMTRRYTEHDPLTLLPIFNQKIDLVNSTFTKHIFLYCCLMGHRNKVNCKALCRKLNGELIGSLIGGKILYFPISHIVV